MRVIVWQKKKRVIVWHGRIAWRMQAPAYFGSNLAPHARELLLLPFLWATERGACHMRDVISHSKRIKNSHNID